uniref:CCHC-type domain-containing protein n=1 Tax=Haemonchus contortus TaxID=6289 RepID=A0A7I4YK67_HAECO
MSSRNDYDFTKKRQAEERKLIDEIRYKRACIETVSKFPEEEDVQHRIRGFVRFVINTVRNNRLNDEFTEIRGRRPIFFANGEATLYRSYLERICLEVEHEAERIRSTAEKLSMAYEVYGLLILSEGAILFSRKTFFGQDEQGVLLEPSHTADFIRKELEFLEQFIRQVQNEIEEAKRQEENENHSSTFNQIKEMIRDLKKDIHIKHMEIQTEMDNQRESMKILCEKFEKMKTITTSSKPDQEEREHREHSKHTKKHSEHEQQRSKPKEVNSEEPEEDLLDLDYDYEEPENRDDSINTPSYVSDDENTRQQRYPGHHKRLELETRLADIREFLMENQGVPERKISEDNPMRPQERYLVCSFCLAKGRHYSDSCPTYVNVKSRMKRARCKVCLDSRHNTEHCRNEIRQCMYCRSEEHNKALCTLPEEIQEAYKEVEEIEHELDNFKEYYRSPTTT